MSHEAEEEGEREEEGKCCLTLTASAARNLTSEMCSLPSNKDSCRSLLSSKHRTLDFVTSNRTVDPPFRTVLYDVVGDKEGSWSQIPYILRRVNDLRVPRSSRCKHAAVGILMREVR